MPRKPRHEAPGAVHHVWARGVNRRTIFEDDGDRRHYLSLLCYVVRDWHWDCFEFSLMPNHIHLLVRTHEPNLGRGMQRLHSLYAQTFNEEHARVGHLFQGRYGSSRIRTSASFHAIVEYIELNPVRAGLAATPADWPWSSAAVRRHGPVPLWLASGRLLEEAAAATEHEAVPDQEPPAARAAS